MEIYSYSQKKKENVLEETSFLEVALVLWPGALLKNLTQVSRSFCPYVSNNIRLIC